MHGAWWDDAGKENVSGFHSTTGAAVIVSVPSSASHCPGVRPPHARERYLLFVCLRVKLHTVMGS